MKGETAVVMKISGRVQGVGFRPAAHRLANELGLRGWALNDSCGAEVALWGREDAIARFREELPRRLPAAACVESVEERAGTGRGPEGFEIRASREAAGILVAGILPDLATCPDCLREIFDPKDRRHRYPFANCTHCGPRYSIVERLPYDRGHTTMRAFRMCAQCEAEYRDPGNRRFHAQPNACPACGPRLSWTTGGQVSREGEDALAAAEAALEGGQIVAAKGIGGFHLMADARSEHAVKRLRERKRRDEKPFAVMFPSMEELEKACKAGAEERAWLQSPAAPILLLERREGGLDLASGIAPGLDRIGAMLPYAPMHHLLLRDLGFPLVATSGNLTDEPICIECDEAMARLGAIADGFLGHDRRIARPMDDSVVAICEGEPLAMRRGRGMAPYSLPMAGAPDGWLAAGAQMKGTVAVAAGGKAVVSSHLGDLDHEASARQWAAAAKDLAGLHGMEIAGAATDCHGDYVSTRCAEALGVPTERVQHHHAHVAACMAENGLEGRVLGIAWDGTGWGPDGTIWGGEFLACERSGFERAAWLRTFPLVGGDAAAREPRRSAFGVLREMGLDWAPPGFDEGELKAMDEALRAGINVAWTSSAGRLFDAAAALLGTCLVATHEGQAPMRLEALARKTAKWAKPYPVGWIGGALDWAPAIEMLLASGEGAEAKAGRFHATLAEMMVEGARRAGIADVVLTGGCFQNCVLLGMARHRLGESGFRVWTHRELPPNDGGISAGQMAVAAARRR